jgi:hypothetical protein
MEIQLGCKTGKMLNEDFIYITWDILEINQMLSFFILATWEGLDNPVTNTSIILL